MTADSILALGAMLSAGSHAAMPIVGALAILGVLLYRAGRRDLALAILVIGVSVIPQVVLLAARPTNGVQDSVALVDAAGRRLAAGLDPYGHDYVDDSSTASVWVPDWPVNPLLAHMPYPPGQVLLGLAAHLLGVSVQWMWIPGTILLALAGRWAAGPLGVVATALNPAVLLDAFHRFNDLFFIAAVLAAIALAGRRRPAAAGVGLAIALLLKQSAVVAAPLLLWMAWRRGGAIRFATAAAVTGALFMAPFVLWDAGAVVRDTASYFYGAGIDAFPIRGPGVAGALLAAGVIPSRWASYPSLPIQLALLVPVAIAARWLLAGESAARQYLWAALLVSALFVGGRTLAPNYVTVTTVFLLLATVSAVEGDLPAQAAVPGDQHRALGDTGEEGAT